MEIIFNIHLFFTIWLTGLVWFVQVVHYPLFKKVSKEEWLTFENEHIRRTTWVTLYPMLIEALSGLILLYIWYTQYMDTVLWYSMLLNAVLSLTIWLSTFLIQVPLHQRLRKKYDARLTDVLTITNWYRVFIWSIRSLLVIYLGTCI